MSVGVGSDVRLKDYGGELVEVTDNGSGVDPANYQALSACGCAEERRESYADPGLYPAALKHHTSKLSEFSDLETVSTFGFRGEALSSLCALSELAVATRTAAQTCGTLLTYNHNGDIISETPCPRAVGTTVTLKNLFALWPVRVREFKKNAKKQYGAGVTAWRVWTFHGFINT
jgi:DNA mismatch repair protein PMS2